MIFRSTIDPFNSRFPLSIDPSFTFCRWLYLIWVRVSNLRSQSLDRLDPWCIWHRISLYFVTLSYLVQILLIFKICRALGFRGVQTLIRYKFLRVLVRFDLCPLFVFDIVVFTCDFENLGLGFDVNFEFCILCMNFIGETYSWEINFLFWYLGLGI